MPGLTNATVITMDNITYIGNSSGVPELFVKVNTIIFGGYLFFSLLMVLFIILTVASYYRRPEILHNILYSSAAVTIVSLFVRAIEVYVYGNFHSLISDKQLWLFPLITMITALVLWATKDWDL